MDTQEAIKFVESEKSSVYTNVFNQKYDEVKGLLWRGERYEKMWNKFNIEYRHLQLFPHGSTLGPNTVALAMDRLFVEFFGSKPDRKAKIDKMIKNIRGLLDDVNSVGQNWRVANIIELFEELRDEEEDV